MDKIFHVLFSPFFSLLFPFPLFLPLPILSSLFLFLLPFFTSFLSKKIQKVQSLNHLPDEGGKIKTPGDNVTDGQKLKRAPFVSFYFFKLMEKRYIRAADVAKSPIFEIRFRRKYNIYIFLK